MRLAALSLVLAALLPASVFAAPSVPTVAVIYFDYQGKNEELALLKKGLASMLISDLAGRDTFSVVERERLEDVLGELKLQSSAKIDQASAVKAGRLLGARYLVLGGFFDVLKTLRVDARVVEVETGKVLSSVGANGAPDSFLEIEQKLASDLGARLEQALARALTPKSKTKQTPANKLAASDAGAQSLATGDAGPKANPPRRARPPKQLKASTAIEYGRALSALDRRDVKEATTRLKKVVADAPDFELASLDLNRLMKQ